jgi:hypothetical protein
MDVLNLPKMNFQKLLSRDEMLLRLQEVYGITGADLILAQCDMDERVFQRVQARLMGITSNSSQFLENTPVEEQRRILRECGLSEDVIDILTAETPPVLEQIEKAQQLHVVRHGIRINEAEILDLPVMRIERS